MSEGLLELAETVEAVDTSNPEQKLLELAFDAALDGERKSFESLVEQFAISYARRFGKGLKLQIIRELGAVRDVKGLIRLRRVGFSQMTHLQIAELTGVSLSAVQKASQTQRVAELAGKISPVENFPPYGG